MKELIVELTAILIIGGLVGFAMSQHTDGAVLSLGIAAIAGIAGYAIPRKPKQGG